MIVWLLYSLFIIVILCVQSIKESFTCAFSRKSNTEFKGINMLGLNSDDGYIPCRNPLDCEAICARNEDCKGYSFYHPGQRCYIFGSGGFVENRPGFYAGIKTISSTHL